MSETAIATILLILIGIVTFFGIRHARTQTVSPKHKTFGGVFWWSTKHSIYGGGLIIVLFLIWALLP